MSWCSSSSSIRPSMPGRPGGSADPGPFFAETHVRRYPPDGHHHLMPRSVLRVPADRQALQGADHVVQPRGHPARAHDHPRPPRHPVLRRIGRRPLLLRHPGLQPLRRLGARGSRQSGATAARPGQLRGLQHPGDRVFLPGELLRSDPQQRARRDRSRIQPDRQPRRAGNRSTVSRIPGVNVAFVPLDSMMCRTAHRLVENTTGRIPDAIVATLQALGTNDASIATLADLVVTRGDFVRVNTTIPNEHDGPGRWQGGTTPAPVSPTAGASRMM